jgi:hypothetical protein
MTITTSASGDTITFASSGSGGSQNLFSTIAVSGQSNVVADSTTDTLTLVAGSGMTITTDASGDSITFASSGSGGGGSSSSSEFAKNTFTGDGSTTAFTLTKTMSSEDGLIVFIDGVYQADNVYSVSGTTLTFATAPVNSRVIEVFQLEGGIVGTAPIVNTMTGDGSDTTLTLSVAPISENQTFLTIDGVVQHKSTYSISGTTLTFSTAPPTGTAVECITFNNVTAATDLVVDSFTGDGSDTTFTLSRQPLTENNTQVYLSGVYQQKSVYSISGTTLTFATAPANGISIEVVSMASASVNSAAILQDADNDTKIQVEESTDEDTIRMDIAGTEVLTLTNSAMTLKGTTPTLTIGDAGAEDTKIVFDGNAQDYYIGLDDSADDLIIGKGSTVGTTPAITIDENLCVGINTTSFASTNRKFVITDTSATFYQSLIGPTSGSAGILFGDTDSNTQGRITYDNSADNLQLWSNNTQRVTIDSTGVGIGTSSPTQKLHVDSGDALIKSAYDASGTTNAYMYFASRASGNWRNSTIGNTGTDLVFSTGGTGTTHTNATERMRIDSSGNALFFRTSVGSLLTTPGSVTTQITDDGVSVISGSQQTQLSTDRINHNALYFYILNENNVGVRLNNTATSWATQSDENLKENIIELTDVISKIKNYRCVEYNLIADETKSKKIGFIAQDWQNDYDQILDEDEDGLGMRYTETIPVLLKAIQEQQEQIETLTARIETLEGGE